MSLMLFAINEILLLVSGGSLGTRKYDSIHVIIHLPPHSIQSQMLTLKKQYRHFIVNIITLSIQCMECISDCNMVELGQALLAGSHLFLGVVRCL